MTRDECEKWGVDPDRFVRAESDRGSVLASVENYFLIKNYAFDKNLVEVDLSIRSPLTHLRVAEALEERGFHPEFHGFSELVSVSIPFPALILFSGRLMLLAGASGGSFFIFDPIEGAITVDKLEMEASWDKSTLSFQNCRTISLKGARFAELIRKHGLEKRAEAHLLCLTAASGILGFGFPRLFQIFLDSVIGPASQAAFFGFSVVLIMMAMMSSWISFARRKTLFNLNLSIEKRISSILYRELYETPKDSGNKARPGEKAVLFSEIRKISRFLSSYSSRYLEKSFGLLLMSIGVFLYSVLAGIVLMALYALAFLWIGRVYREKYSLFGKMTEARSSLHGMLSEGMGSLVVIKANHAEKNMETRWEGKFIAYLKERMAFAESLISSSMIQRVATGIILISLLLLVALRPERQGLSPGEVLAVALYLISILRILSSLAAEAMQLVGAHSSWDHIQSRLKPAMNTQEAQIGRSSRRLMGGVRFEGVCFRYPGNERYALKDLNFDLLPGKTLAVVGKSGSGKSTLGRIAASLHSPTYGKVFYDGVSGTQISSFSLRSQIGMIQQENTLFQGTVHSNLTFAEDTWRYRDIRRALIDADAFEFVEELPQKGQQSLGEGGSGLSGGEKQRLSMARMLLRFPRLLIFDEATSSLDPSSEARIAKNLVKILAGRTAILITHRLSTALLADRILVMDEGRALDTGSHSELMKRSSLYQEIMGNQSDQNHDD